MADDTKIVLRDGQWLKSGPLFADFGDEEVIVVIDSAAAVHPLLTDLPDNEHGQSVQSSREAMHLASLAATLAMARGSKDDDGNILVQVEDLKAVK